MNLPGAEPILDQLAAIIGIFMFLVAAYVFIKLLTQPKAQKRAETVETPEEEELFPEKKPAIPKAQMQPEPVMARSFGQFAASSAATQVQTAPISPSIPPELAFSKVSKSGSNLIRLSLINVGSDMRFEQVRPDKFNEVDVTFQSKAMLGSNYKSKSAMNFLLKGQNLDYATYHFKVYFKDRRGRRFMQEIAGLGDEVPIVEAPVQSNS
ncbi:MAG: hypothetical protein MRZ79_10775 [Bacteroidia bacterium]|nr:hypothetical protein [Bacteroidia bacterium]